MKAYLAAALVGTALFAGIAAEAQAQRVRGTVTSASGNMIAVKTSDGGSVDIALGEKTNYVFAQPVPMSDIKQGDFLGVTSVKRVDGTLTAYDVRRFPKPTNPGHRPFDGGSNQTMTNALVSTTVNSAKGRELVLTYDGGSQKVMVAETASITSLTPGQRSQVVTGSYVSVLTEPGADGKLTARAVEVRKDEPKVPK